MTLQQPLPALSHVDDQELERLATLWRAQALRGNREAFGIAHALEVEQRRRLRPSQMANLAASRERQARESAKPRRWWQLWKRPAGVPPENDPSVDNASPFQPPAQR